MTRISLSDLREQLATIERLKPAPEGMEWGLNVYNPGGTRLIRFEITNKLDGENPGLGYEPFGTHRRTVKEHHEFAQGLIQAWTVDLEYQTARHKEIMEQEKARRERNGQ